MGQALNRLSGGLHGYWNASREEEEVREASLLLAQAALDDTASSSSARFALVPFGTRSTFLQELAAPPPRFITRSSDGRGTNGGIPLLCWSDVGGVTTTLTWMADYDLEAGGQAYWVGARGTGGVATPVQKPSEVAKMLEGVMVQGYATCLPACVTAYPLLKDAPDHIKFTIFGGLAFTTVVLFVGLLSRSVACRRLAIRFVSFSAIAVLAFTVASQLSGPTYIALTALAGVALNLIVMLLQF